jgi:hypothetical protein
VIRSLRTILFLLEGLNQQRSQYHWCELEQIKINCLWQQGSCMELFQQERIEQDSEPNEIQAQKQYWSLKQSYLD